MPMYVPGQFAEQRIDVLADAMRTIKLAALVMVRDGELQITHLPLQLTLAPDASFVLRGHVARANMQARFEGVMPAAAIFQGPQAYVSPSFYPSKHEHGKVVPTWNYIAIHAHGDLQAIHDEDWLMNHLATMSQESEAARAAPWAMADAPPDYIAGRVRTLIGLEFRVTRIDAAWKMNQHRSTADRLGTIAGLASDPQSKAVADIMLEIEAARKE